jgi:allophanate hydrolase subunit 1
MKYEVGTRDTIIEALKEENLKLEKVIIDSSNTHWHVFASLGFVAGAILTIVIVETVE